VDLSVGGQFVGGAVLLVLALSDISQHMDNVMQMQYYQITDCK